MSDSGYYKDGEALSDRDLEQMYDEWLDELEGMVRVGAIEFFASDVLREMDPIAYRVGLHDYIDHMLTDGEITDVAEEWTEVWLRDSNEDSDFEPGEDGYCNAEANVYMSDTGYRVEWYLTAVGLVKSVEFDTLTDAYDWLESEGFANYTS